MLSSTLKKKERQEKILLSLDKMGMASRKQLQKIHKLGSDRHALAILNELKPYLTIKKLQHTNVYYLNGNGRDLIGSTNEVKWNLSVEHTLMRNDIYIHFDCPSTWATERSVTFKTALGLNYKEVKMIPDAMFNDYSKFYFIEIDRTQSMKENKKKIALYASLRDAMKHQFKELPVIVFYTVTEHRREIILRECKAVSLECLVLTKEDL